MALDLVCLSSLEDRVVPARFLAESGRFKVREVGELRAESSTEPGELGTELLELASGLLSPPAELGADKFPFADRGGTALEGGVERPLEFLTTFGLERTASEIVLLIFTGDEVGFDKTASEMVDGNLEGEGVAEEAGCFLVPGAEPERVGVELSALDLDVLLPDAPPTLVGTDLEPKAPSEAMAFNDSFIFSANIVATVESENQNPQYTLPSYSR